MAASRLVGKTGWLCWIFIHLSLSDARQSANLIIHGLNDKNGVSEFDIEDKVSNRPVLQLIPAEGYVMPFRGYNIAYRDGCATLRGLKEGDIYRFLTTDHNGHHLAKLLSLENGVIPKLFSTSVSRGNLTQKVNINNWSLMVYWKNLGQEPDDLCTLIQNGEALHSVTYDILVMTSPSVTPADRSAGQDGMTTGSHPGLASSAKAGARLGENRTYVLIAVVMAALLVSHFIFREPMMSRKRKIDSEYRLFKEHWTYDDFFMQYKERAMCLICQNIVSVFKEYNLRRHYETHHKDKYQWLVGEVRQAKILKLKNTLTTQQNTFVKQKQQNIASLRASFQVAKLIARTGRPLVEGEFVKECLLSVAKEMCPEKDDLFSTVSLSGPTITWRIEEMGDNLHQHLQNSSKKLSYFSLALDESNDVRDSAQLLIRGTNDDFKVTEELAALRSIKGTTTGEDIYQKVCQTVNGLELDWAKLASVTTDGAPSMVGSKKGVIARINQEMDKRNHTHPIAIHCLIHQQALCSKSLKWDSVMKIVSSVNFIRAHALNHSQFQEFLSELNVDCEDVLYHTEVCWLSRGRVLKRFYDLLQQITTFLLSKYKEVPELNDAEWKWHLAFLTDVTEVLNHFNVQLQGKGKLICDMQSVKAFEVKLGLMVKQVKEENFCHLPTTQNLSAFPNKTCVDSPETLQKDFQFKFKELHLHEQDIQLFLNPFSIDIENVDTVYQMELAHLQNCDSLKDAFKSSSHSFFASLPSETYPHLRNHALKMATIFGSTYVCEQTFCRTKLLKSPTRSRLTDAHLHHLLRLAVTNMEPDIDFLISQKQAHSSH